MWARSRSRLAKISVLEQAYVASWAFRPSLHSDAQVMNEKGHVRLSGSITSRAYGVARGGHLLCSTAVTVRS
eukprot:7561757-Pyramimonas_sp.AAC.1